MVQREQLTKLYVCICKVYRGVRRVVLCGSDLGSQVKVILFYSSSVQISGLILTGFGGYCLVACRVQNVKNMILMIFYTCVCKNRV